MQVLCYTCYQVGLGVSLSYSWYFDQLCSSVMVIIAVKRCLFDEG